MRWLLYFSVLLTASLASNSISAQTESTKIAQGYIKNLSQYQRKKYLANRDTVGLVTGPITGTYVQIGADLSSVLNNTNMRILPIISKGSLQNMNDILYLRGIDVGIIQADVLSYFIKKNPNEDVKNRVAYITKLYNEEAHILASERFSKLSELSGEKVNFGKIGSGTAVTAETVFSRLQINAIPTRFDSKAALQKLIKGEIAAMVFVAGKPSSLMKSLKGDYKLRLLPIPYSTELQDIYLPSVFSNKDYPNHIGVSERIPTVATSAVMAVYNWQSDSPRYKKVRRFIEAFFTRINEFSDSARHPKWKEVSLSAKVPGWNRFSIATQTLSKFKGSRGGNNITTQKSVSDIADKFRRYLKLRGLGNEKMTDEQQKKLFSDFLVWSTQQ